MAHESDIDEVERKVRELEDDLLTIRRGLKALRRELDDRLDQLLRVIREEMKRRTL